MDVRLSKYPSSDPRVVSHLYPSELERDNINIGTGIDTYHGAQGIRTLPKQEQSLIYRADHPASVNGPPYLNPLEEP